MLAYSWCTELLNLLPTPSIRFEFYLQIDIFLKWSRGDSNPRPPPCKVRASYIAGYRLMSEIRFSEPDSALLSPCYCRQMSSLIAPTAATLLPSATLLAGLLLSDRGPKPPRGNPTNVGVRARLMLLLIGKLGELAR